METFPEAMSRSVRTIDGVTPFVPNRRGDTLAAYRIDLTRSGHEVRLRGPADAVRHLLALPTDVARYQARWPGRPERVEWTHLLVADTPPDPRIKDCLDILCHVVSVPCPEITAMVVLDWYKDPEGEVDPQLWRNTTAGELTSRAKYRYSHNAYRQAEVGRVLVGAMVTVIEALPHYAAADAVLGVPGHDRSQVSFGARIAPTLQEALNLPHVRVQPRDSYRPQMKSLAPAERVAALKDQFTIAADLTGKVVIIADDVLRSGSSLRAVAQAARAAGAVRTLGIAIVRTMRS